MRKKLALLLLLISAACGISLSAQTPQRISILGDSYSTFEGFIKPDTNAIWYFKTPNPELTDVSNVRQTWWHQFIKKNGHKLCVNNSFSGSTICNTGYNGEDYSSRSFIARMKDLGSPDVILIFGGTNDSWAGAPIGEFKYENWTEKDLYSVRPALAYMLSTIIDYYPNVGVTFIINSELKPEVTESIIEVCRHYDVDYILLHDIHKIAGHPSVAGMEAIANQLTTHFKK